MGEPYVTWEEVAAAVQGEERLRDMLLPRIETASVHPYFDQQVAVAQRLADVDLELAGYVVPLTSITDTLLRHAIIGLVVGLLTESSSSREQWQIDLYNAGLAYFKKVREGAPVGGLTVDDTPSTASILVGAGNNDLAPIFDYEQPNAEVLSVFAGLGAGPDSAWWRR
jgi:hypothetical protein